MASKTLFKFSLFFLLLGSLMACGPRETPEQHLARLRAGHDIVPTGVIPSTDAEGNARIIVDLRITNKTAEKLNHLTILVRVTGADNSEKLLKPVTLDLRDARPGVGLQLAAIVDGYTLAEDDQVAVEIARGLSPEQLRSLPEYNDLKE